MGAMRRLSWLVLAAGLCLAALARAGEPLELLQGYDKAHWGQTPEEVNAMAVAKILWDKYYADSGARAQLAQHRVLVSMRPDATNLEPMSAVDLLPGQSGLLSTWYMNLDCWDRQVAQAQDRKQQEKEKARKAASENNLRQAL